MKSREFFTDLKEVYITVHITTERGVTVERNLHDVFEFANYLKANPEIARALNYVEKKKR